MTAPRHLDHGGQDDIARAMACVRGRRFLLGPMATWALSEPAFWAGLFDAVHTHTVTSSTLALGSRTPAAYGQLEAERDSFAELIGQMPWAAVAELELYRGCTRKAFCRFCNEPSKSPAVAHRAVEDVLAEAGQLYDAGVRHFRLGQQTCFFSYQGRSEAAVRALLGGTRERCPDLEMLHIDNADPLAVAAPVGKRIAAAVAEFCTRATAPRWGSSRSTRP
ncbi:hypothetical protein [Streptomyces sp. NPDC002845]